jgi:pyruvate kinase
LVDMTRPAASLQVRRLQKRLESLGNDVRRGERARLATWRPRLVGSAYAGSAANLAAYLAFRHHDIRDIQDQLAVLGLSSLGRTEAHVRSGIAAVEAALAAFLGDAASLEWVARIGRLRDAQARLVAERAAVLLGPERPERRTRVMVTLPEEGAADAGLVRDLVERGMDIARINAAHDGPDTWRAMALGVRSASRDAGRDCRILLDLPGPKMRIGPLPSAPGRLRLRSPRDEGGRSVFLLDGSGAPGTAHPPEGEQARVAVDAAWLSQLEVGDRIAWVDAHGRPRTLRVETQSGAETVAVSTSRGIALSEGIELILVREKRKRGVGLVGRFEPEPGSIAVHVGDVLRLLADQPRPTPGAGDANPGDPWITCLQTGALEALQAGHHVDIDDGHIVTRVEAVDSNQALLRVLTTRRPEERVRADQGLNFPNSPIRGQGFGPDDLLALDVAADIADIVGLSFAQTPEDVDRLIEELDARGARDIGVIAKIETQGGVERLPDIIVAGASRRPFGVMIARGDLAIEIGYERLAEMQEELLWVCEAARVPVIWATQVLESMVKTGIPTRAELTDAAMGARAECVMLNKGPHILDGVDTLVDVVVRMETHQSKKTSRLRALQSW